MKLKKLVFLGTLQTLRELFRQSEWIGLRAYSWVDKCVYEA